MSPTIRLGGEQPALDRAAPATPRVGLTTARVTIAGVPSRSISVPGSGAPTLLLHGWMDNAETWIEVLAGLASAGRPAVAYDLPGFGTAPALDPGSVLDQLVEFAAAAVEHAAEQSGREVVAAGNSLGGWTALRLAEHDNLPLAGIAALAPAGLRMAPFFFTVDRIPAVSRLISLPSPVPASLVRSLVGRFYRSLAFADPAAVEQRVVDRFTRHNVDRRVLRERIDYAKRLRGELESPFDPARIDLPVTVLWGERDRLCMPAGAAELARMLPEAKVEMLGAVGHTPQVEATETVVGAIAELAGPSR